MLQAFFLCIAAEKGYVHIIETLLLYGADVNAQPYDTVRPFCR